MITNVENKFNNLLLSSNFRKYHKYYFRILNNNIFQTIGLVYVGGLWRLTFFSDVLNALDYLEEHLQTLELVHDGYDISQLINQESICYTKEEAMALLNEEIMDKLNKLIDVKMHILFFEEQKFIDEGRICLAPYLYYLYADEYEKAEIEYSKKLDLEIEAIVSCKLNNIIWKEKGTKNEFRLELVYKQYLLDLKELEKIKNRDSFAEYFNSNYQKNKKILENYYGKN